MTSSERQLTPLGVDGVYACSATTQLQQPAQWGEQAQPLILRQSTVIRTVLHSDGLQPLRLTAEGRVAMSTSRSSADGENPCGEDVRKSAKDYQRCTLSQPLIGISGSESESPW